MRAIETTFCTAAVAFRKSFRYVTIEPDDDSLGHILFQKWDASFRPDICGDLHTRVLCENSAIISLAGPSAGAHFSRREKWRCVDSDMENAFSMIDYMSNGPKETEAYIAWLAVRSRGFVCSEVHWPQIEAVARELLAKPKGERRLSARQVREICRRVTQDLVRQRATLLVEETSKREC
jgi:hypothetical protein